MNQSNGFEQILAHASLENPPPWAGATPAGLTSGTAEPEPRSSGNVRQPNHARVDWIAGHKAERRPGPGEEGLATTKHNGAEVESVLVDKAKSGQASCQFRAGDFNLTGEPRLQATDYRLDVIGNEGGIRAYRVQ